MNVIARIPSLFMDQDIAFSFAAPAAEGAELLVHEFSASQAVFGLDSIHVGLVSKDGDIDLHALLDTPATLTVHHKYAGARHFAGVIAEIERGEEGFHRTLYSLTLLPMLHRLAHGSDCRIFQQKSVPDIIKEILKTHGIEDVKWDLTAEHAVREYCVQYRESHLGYLERLCAEEGIWFYHTSGENGQHTLHFIDNPQIVADLEGQPSLEYNAMPSGAVKGVFCNRFSFKERLRSTSFTQRDYTFKNPPYSQEHRQDRQEDNGSAKDYALYDYPGRYKQDVAGKPFTKYRQEAVRVDATTGQGLTNAIHLSPGFKMALTEHPNDACNTAWHLLEVDHHGRQPQALGEEAGGGPATYSASFTAMPARLPFRPMLRAKPLVDGPQIAHVTGPDGEEIYCDEYGRVKVWFPWQREVAKNDKSSCWIRVASNWAGPKWGHIAIPRIGQEVIVDFLEGDPDQPIITGRTYHAQNMPPNKLPDFKTRMVLMSDSHKANGSNELRFEDEGGQEEVWFHAQKYHNAVVKDNETWKIGGSRHKRVDGSQSESIGGSKDIEVKGDHREAIDGSQHLLVKGSLVEEVKLSQFLKVVGDKVSHVVRNCVTLVEQHYRLETKGKQHFEAATTHYINAGDSVVIQAGSAISLNVGGNFVKIDGSGVQIEGSLVKVNCGGSPKAGSEVEPSAVANPQPYSGPHAQRYARSYEK
ncbi:type VI secretion system Vgr family protein [Roseibium sediminis]|uniref:type VI secretion system Vgr family protein n=1 Tax=Roseibium sediminis TaxID=1775174 RepID=UPI00123D1BB2|nr:type VI secretion system tip protein TssI/VgrG [Roseibium sediminis]